MALDIRLPNITAASEAGQLAQIRSYLYQFAEQLQWAFNTMPAGGDGTAASAEMTAAGSTGAMTETEAQSTFNDIKSLIIKSADIVNAYYEQIHERLEGEYVAQSDFGTFAEQTTQDIEKNSTAIEQNFQDIQKLLTDIDVINEIVANAYIRSGLLYYDNDGAPVYGLEIGQQNIVDGVEVFNKYARFTSGKLSFYDKSGNEVALISDNRMEINNAEIKQTLTVGRYVIDTAGDGLIFKWV